jgi:hypothetical protein
MSTRTPIPAPVVARDDAAAARLVLCFALGLAALLALPVHAAEPPLADDSTRAANAVHELGSRLRSALVARIAAAGAPAAVGFCADEAPGIAAAVAAEHGLRIGRTALRVRNADNAASAWQSAALEGFARDASAGTAPASLRSSATTGLPAGVRLRYMQGIATEAPCLACHGTQVQPAIAQAIRARYPDDAATGFSEGSLRGAFWVEVGDAAGSDARRLVALTPTQQDDLRAQMRAHMASTQAMLAALAADDWQAVASAADGFGPGQAGAGGHSFRAALPAEWFTFAQPMHMALRELADEARGEQRMPQALRLLADAHARCVGCHAVFRVGAR